MLKSTKILKSIHAYLRKHEAVDQNPRSLASTLTKQAQTSLDRWKPSSVRTDTPASIQVIDFFCGCGGMSLGFAALGTLFPSFRLVGGCDIDPVALSTYRRNFCVPAIMADVRVLAEEVSIQDFLGNLDRYDVRQPLVVIGCAPCQGFTSHRKKNWSQEDDRNSLLTSFASLAVRLDPVCIVMENVPEMLSKKYWDYFSSARAIMETNGYTLHQTIYNAASFGVPQERFRTLVIAMKREFLLPELLIEDPSEFATVRQAIGRLPEVNPGEEHPKDRLHRSALHRSNTIETIRAIPRDGGSRPAGVGPKCLDRVNGFYDVYGRLYWDKPAITITHYSRNPASGRFVHPEQNRGLTTREAAILQSFPLGFQFEGSFDSIFKQIGEAVPPKFACAVAAHVLLELVSSPPTKHEMANGMQSIESPVQNSYSSLIAGFKMKRDIEKSCLQPEPTCGERALPDEF